MLTPRERLTVYLPPVAADRVRAIADDRGITVSDALRMALGLLDVAERARADGLHMGTSRDREALETVMVAPL